MTLEWRVIKDSASVWRGLPEISCRAVYGFVGGRERYSELFISYFNNLYDSEHYLLEFNGDTDPRWVAALVWALP
jgi:hypothetical protein